MTRDTAADVQRITSHPFCDTGQGRMARRYRFTNRKGNQVDVTDLGAHILAWRTPGRDGKMADIVLEHARPEDYLANRGHLGAIPGRYAGRIANAEFTLDGKTYRVPPKGAGPHALHPNAAAFERRLWQAEPFETASAAGLRLSLTSPDGEDGFPGMLRLTVTYSFDDEDRLIIDYQALSDKPTVLNLTQHVYFNLAGHGSGDIGAHEAQIAATQYLPVNAEMVPLGFAAPVAGTALDLRTPKPLNSVWDAPDPQIRLGGGIDHCWALGDAKRVEPAWAARVTDPASGRSLDLYTDQPGLIFYSGNNMAEMPGKDGARYGRRHGFCLETQNFPNAVNQPGFPSAIIKAGETYTSRTIFQAMATA